GLAHDVFPAGRVATRMLHGGADQTPDRRATDGRKRRTDAGTARLRAKDAARGAARHGAHSAVRSDGYLTEANNDAGLHLVRLLARIGSVDVRRIVRLATDRCRHRNGDEAVFYDAQQGPLPPERSPASLRDAYCSVTGYFGGEIEAARPN